jgi:hypothetical protein
MLSRRFQMVAEVLLKRMPISEIQRSALFALTYQKHF